MLFAIMMLDKPASESLRAHTRDAHRDYIGKHGDGMRMGGPLLAEDGSRVIGSLIVKEFANRGEAEAFVAAEPYNRAGLFELVVIRPFQPVVDQPASS